MNLFVIVLLAISLGGSAWIGFEPIDDWLERSLVVVATAAMVPAIALFQSGIVLQRIRAKDFGKQEFESTYRRMAVVHAVVWLTASAAIIWVLRWQDVVRGTWELGNWPVLDELVILLPGTLGMVTSWLVFYELQGAMAGPSVNSTRSEGCKRQDFQSILQSIGLWVGPRWKFIAIRFRVYFLAILVPMVLVVLSIDLQQLNVLGSDAQVRNYAIGGALILALVWPFIMMLVWSTEPIPGRGISVLNPSAGLPEFRQLKLRRWNTGGQIANAAVIGLIPRMRYIFLSDVILDKFSPAEINAIVRHEMGHIHRYHAWWRLGFLMLPVFVLSPHQPWLNATASIPFEFNLGQRTWALEVSPAWAAFLILSIGAAWLSNRWLSHQMEYEADLEAIQSCRSLMPEDVDSGRDPEISLDPGLLEQMRDALLRLAAYAGEDWKRATLFHPSIKSRLDFLNRLEIDSLAAARFRAQFLRFRLRLALGWTLFSMAGLGAWL